MDNSQYNKMAEAFGADYEQEENMMDAGVPVRTRDDIKTEISLSNTDMLPAVVENVIEDQAYIKQEIKIGVEMLGDVAETLRGDLKQGSRASSFEAFASIMKERREYINSLEQVNSNVYDRNNANTNPSDGSSIGSITNNNLVMTSDDMLELILTAKNGLDSSKEVHNVSE